MTFKYSFDSQCLGLAEHFLPPEATDAVKKELAQAVQDAVEDFLCGRSFVAPPPSEGESHE